MVQHVPNVMCPNQISLQVFDLPSKTYIGEEAMNSQVRGQIQRFMEKFPRETKWIQYAPQDGDPPMKQWEQIYKMSDQVVAMSEYGKQIFKKFFDMEVPRIWHGVDTAVFTNQEKPKQFKNMFVVGNLNRNQPRKQPVRCMKAFAKFAKDKPDVLLHMQMDWNDEFGWPLQYFAQLFGIQNKMVPPQRVGMTREEVAKVYNMWDLNYNCTGGEGFGLCHIEGFACGVPSLGCDYTTSRELIMGGSPGPRGSLVKVKDLLWQKMDVAAVQRSLVDEDDLADVYNRYYYNRDLVTEHGKNAEKWVKKNCSWAVIALQWVKVVENVLSGDNNGKM
jgi:glycosyltransferase involved in cell wall biosynthesis